MHQTVAYFLNLGISTVLITLGEQGTYYATKNEAKMIPACSVKAVDTTAAGDTFIGALVSELKPDLSNIKEAIIFANQASSLTVQRKGAQVSIPTRLEVQEAYH